jgi:hypothetical protein
MFIEVLYDIKQAEVDQATMAQMFDWRPVRSCCDVRGWFYLRP